MANDGGLAFPAKRMENATTAYSHEWVEVTYPGMTLRDYFAAAALPAALQQEATSDEGRPCMYDEAAVARVAYRLADAMLKAREQA